MIVEPQSIETVKMATGALRSAADDLIKTDPTLEYRIPQSSKRQINLFARLMEEESIRIKDVGYIIKMLAQDLEGK